MKTIVFFTVYINTVFEGKKPDWLQTSPTKHHQGLGLHPQESWKRSDWLGVFHLAVQINGIVFSPLALQINGFEYQFCFVDHRHWISTLIHWFSLFPSPPPPPHSLYVWLSEVCTCTHVCIWRCEHTSLVWKLLCFISSSFYASSVHA